MILNGEVIAYSTKAVVRAHTFVGYFTYGLEKEAGEISGPKMDAVIRGHYDPELAACLVGRDHDDRVYDDPQGWDTTDEIQSVDVGYFLFADEIDWEEGRLRIDRLAYDSSFSEWLFRNDDLLATEIKMPYFEAEFSGISFDLTTIEMLVPNTEWRSSGVARIDSGSQVRMIGRPPKWDWEGVLAYVVSQAQQPDGLPTGHGAQAQLEEMMASWFVQEVGDAPAPSMIRQHASKVMQILQKPVEPKRLKKPKKD
jgi:hypothetical protein